MTFRQCVVIALAFHLALMMFPLKEHTRGQTKRVRLVVTGKAGITVNSVKDEVLPEKKQKVQPSPHVVHPEKPAIEQVVREMPVRKKPLKEAKKQERKKKAKPETSILSRAVDIEHEVKTDTASEYAVPQNIEIPIREEAVRQPIAAEPLEVAFGSAEGPRFLKRIVPEYPLKERRLGKTGVVVLMLAIDAKGRLINVEVIKEGGTGFTSAAVVAIKNSSFIAARRNGSPVACKAVLPIRFRLR